VPKHFIGISNQEPRAIDLPMNRKASKQDQAPASNINIEIQVKTNQRSSKYESLDKQTSKTCRKPSTSASA